MFTMKSGAQLIDCSSNGDGITLHTLLDLLSTLERPVRLDDVLISPNSVGGKLVLSIEITERYRHAKDGSERYLTVEE